MKHPRRSARIPPQAPPRQDRRHADQAADHPARPVAGLLARRRAACEEIVANPAEASTLTSRGNLVAVITNGTAVLGLGNIGPLAGKPVMEGKGVLFKKFAGIDVFDIEIDENDPDKLVDIIASLEPTFGGINLEDIKAPECFYIEKKLRERMRSRCSTTTSMARPSSPRAVLNGLRVVGKKIERSSWCAPAPVRPPSPAWTCWSRLGSPRERLDADSKGVVSQGA
jgi:malate dehydrogenase (oxaloacetate-decarboxylating)(NADP+)